MLSDSPLMRRWAEWQLRDCAITLGERTLVVGILNCTPDSFSGDGRREVESAVTHGLALLDEGAAILDVGGESTRPGSRAGTAEAISTGEEQDRVLPVLQGLLSERPGAVLSIDTYRAATAKAAVLAGAAIVNDVSGLLWDVEMAATCAELQCGLVLMHTRGGPSAWGEQPALARGEVAPLVLSGLRDQLRVALEAGIGRERIVLDPGYGFGKAREANFELLARQQDLLALGLPLLAGVSRKGFLGKALAPLRGGQDASSAERDNATVAACTAAVLHGASLLRVHAVGAAVEAAAIADAIVSARE